MPGLTVRPARAAAPVNRRAEPYRGLRAHLGTAQLGRSADAALTSISQGRLIAVPSPEAAPGIAASVLEHLGLAPQDGRDLEAIFSALGWLVRSEPMGARDGRHEAMLIPRSDGGFVVFVDPDLTPAERAASSSPATIRRLRLAHELGHCLFYSATSPPRRAIPVTPAEEQFCDAFARALTHSR